MFAKIAALVFPGQEVELPRLPREEAAGASAAYEYSPPIQKLVDEHVVIKRVVALIPRIVETADLEAEAGRRLVLDAVDFISSYADHYHHAKEEEILFTYFDEDLEILRVIRQDHEAGRAHVRAVREAVEGKDAAAAREHLEAYRELLNEHIKKEDEILYPWIDRQLTDDEVGRLFSQFAEVERQFGEAPAAHEAFVARLEQELN
jgi:hemerythrin-like domain-containing protein